jgi:glycosyltransferase involved in cell wall biosynthesis/SAM-dependent methyltransferase
MSDEGGNPAVIPLAVSIDTEEDNWKSVSSGISTENIRELPRLSRFLEGLGIRATFFVSYQVARLPWAAGILREIAGAGPSEIAAHVHPWNTPPYDNTASSRPTMLRNHTLDEQTAKVRTVTETIAETIGARPISFRAGRFGVGPETITALVRNGYRVDSSVTPFLSWAAYDRGPDFFGAPVSLYRLDGGGDVRVPTADGPITEVPLSAGFTRFALGHWPKLERLSRGSAAQAIHLAGIAARTGLVRRSILSPEVASVKDMLALSRCLLAGGVTHLQLFFHSSSLRPGLSPFVTSRADLDRLYGKIAAYVEGLAKLRAISPSTVGEIGSAATPPRSVPAYQAQFRAETVASDQPAPATPRRLLVICPRFQPDSVDGDMRWVGFTKYLVRRGWEAHVLTVGNGADDSLREGVQTHGGPRGVFGSGAKARELVRRFQPDVVLSSGPPDSTHLAGFLATLHTRVPLVLDHQDSWEDQAAVWRGKASLAAIARQVSRMLEDVLFHHARDVIANSRDLADALKERHPGSHVSFLRSGADLELLPQRPTHSGPRLSIAHAGAHSDDRVLEPVLRALRLFLERTAEATGSSRFMIAGRVAAERAAQLAAIIRVHRLESNVELLGVVPPTEALELLARSQVSVVFAPSQMLQVPTELYSSLCLGVPTLVCGDSESATAREARHLGAAFREPEDIEGIARFFDGAWRGTHGCSHATPDPIDYEHLAGALEALLTCSTAPSGRTGESRDTAELPSAFELQGEPRANWMWLADLPGFDRALELTAGSPVLAPALQLSFSEVNTHDYRVALQRSQPMGTMGDLDERMRLPYGDESFDCVFIHGVWPHLMELAGAVRSDPDALVLSECRRVLRPGGCLYIAAFNPRYRRLRAAAPLGQSPHLTAAVGMMRRRLQAAGFSRCQSYYVTPSHVIPRDIIPIARAAVSRYEQFTASHSLPGWLRRVLAAVGLHQVLFPSVAYLAYR